MANWMKTWRRASYRGAQFWVDKDQIETGRRLVVHEFPHRDVPYVEDMGRAANKISVTAYVASESVLDESDALFKACQDRGAATLQLPAERLKAHCEKCERAWDKDKQGFIAFSLSFWREGSGPGPHPAPYLARLTWAAADAIGAPLEAATAAAVQVVGQAGFVRDSFVDEIEAAASAIDAVRAGLTLDQTKAPAIARAIQAIHDESDNLAEIGLIGDVYEDRAYRATAAGSAEVLLVARVTGVLADIRDSTQDQAAAAREFETLTEYGFGEVSPWPVFTPSARQAEINALALRRMIRIAALAQWAVAKTEIKYTDRRAAIQARADVAEHIDAELDTIGGPEAYGAYLAILEVRDTAVQFFTRLLADLAPVLIVGAPASMPSLWWSWHLYADASRAGDLAKRNRVKHPSFMPLDFEALAR